MSALYQLHVRLKVEVKIDHYVVFGNYAYESSDCLVCK